MHSKMATPTKPCVENPETYTPYTDQSIGVLSERLVRFEKSPQRGIGERRMSKFANGVRGHVTLHPDCHTRRWRPVTGSGQPDWSLGPCLSVPPISLLWPSLFFGRGGGLVRRDCLVARR